MICRALTRLGELQEIGQACFIGSLNHDDEVTGGLVPSDFLVDSPKIIVEGVQAKRHRAYGSVLLPLHTPLL
jgi:hypothetical protein